jgi:HKD family nuclease
MFYNQPLARRFGTDLIALFSSGEWTEVDIAVAWVRESGLRHLRESVEGFLKNKGKLRVVVGIDLDNTSKEGLAGLLELEALGVASTFVNHNESGSVFHPKLYLFRKAGAAKLIVGSNNITEAGLFRNTEAGLQINCDSAEPVIAETVSAIDEWCNTSSGLGRRLDPMLLQQLEAGGYVSGEKSLRYAAAQRRASARKPGSQTLFKSVTISAPTLPVAGRSSGATKGTATTRKAPTKPAAKASSNKSSAGNVLIMRIRTARGTQTQMPMPVIASSFFNGQKEVQSLHDGVKRGIHVAHSAGKENTLKLEVPETASMQDPMIRFERTSTGIRYQVWDKATSAGTAIWSSLNQGLTTSPPSTFLTKPRSPSTSTWWRFI